MNAVDNLKRTALHLASLNGKVKVVKALLETGIKVYAVDNSFNTAHHYAEAGGHGKIINMLDPRTVSC